MGVTTIFHQKSLVQPIHPLHFVSKLEDREVWTAAGSWKPLTFEALERWERASYRQWETTGRGATPHPGEKLGRVDLGFGERGQCLRSHAPTKVHRVPMLMLFDPISHPSVWIGSVPPRLRPGNGELDSRTFLLGSSCRVRMPRQLCWATP
jgi:hypothetical protein